MNRKAYYMDLAERWFEAETSEAEERELKSFLATTDDPAFDEVRAAMGFLCAARAADSSVSQRLPQNDKTVRRTFRLVPVLAVAASVAAAFFIGRMSATPLQVVVEDGGSYVSYVHGVEVADEDFAVASMESTLSDLFSSVPDPMTDLSLIFNSNE